MQLRLPALILIAGVLARLDHSNQNLFKCTANTNTKNILIIVF